MGTFKRFGYRWSLTRGGRTWRINYLLEKFLVRSRGLCKGVIANSSWFKVGACCEHVITFLPEIIWGVGDGGGQNLCSLKTWFN